MTFPMQPQFACELCEDEGVVRKEFNGKLLPYPCNCETYLCTTCRDSGYVTPETGNKIAVPCGECRLGNEYAERDYEDMMKS